MLKKSLLLIVIFFTSSAYASTSKVKEYKSFADFKDGEFKSVSLSEKGELRIAPAVAKYFDAATQHVWQIASAGGKMYAATGTPLKIYQMTGKDSTTVYTSEAPTLFAMTGSGNGVLYFAPAPGGIIYKFQNGTVSEIANLETKYIWHLLPDNDDVLVATGDPGLILRITQQGNVDTVFTSTETHIRVLALDAKGMLYAGSADHGLVYRFNKNLKPFVLYDSPETEIFSIIPLKNGEIWVAGMSEKLTRPVITPASVSSPSSGSAGQAEVKNGSDPLEALMANGAGSKGGIYRITANGVARNFWQGQSQRVQALALRNDGNVLVGTGDAGKLYLLDRNGEITQLLDIDSEQIANFYPLQKSVLLATSNNGAIYELDAKPALKGQYLSEAFDAGSFTNWGSLSWSGQGSIAFSVRSGNTEKPDATWSEWAKLPISADPVAISSPTARFIQWQAELSNNAVLQSLTFGYKQQNIAPVLQEIKIHKPEDAYLEDVKEGLQGKPQKTGATLGKKSSEKRLSIGELDHE